MKTTFLDNINRFKSMKEKKLLSRRFRYSPSPNFTMTETEKRHVSEIQNKIINEEYKYTEPLCPVCDLNEFLVIGEKDRCGLPVFTALCKNCGLLQSSPRLRDIDYRDFYENHYRYIWGNERQISKESFFRGVYEGRANKQYKFIKQNLDLKVNSKILDYACGSGALVCKLSEGGYDCIGIDYDSQNLEYGKSIGLNLSNCSMEDVGYSKKYALIIMSHSLEHLSNPKQYLNNIQGMIENDGYLFIEVPCIQNWRYTKDLMHAINIPHIFGFTVQSLSNLLGKAGFTLITHEGGTGGRHLSAIFQKNKKQYILISDFQKTETFLRSIERNRFFQIDYMHKKAKFHTYKFRSKVGLAHLSSWLGKMQP